MAPKTPVGRFLGNPKGLPYGGRNGTRNTLKYHVLKEDELKEDFALKDTTGQYTQSMRTRRGSVFCRQ